MSHANTITQEFNQVFESAEEALNELFNGDKSVKISELMSYLTSRNNWDVATTRENDVLLRRYFRNHPEWGVVLGKNGGINKRANINAKKKAVEERSLAKENAKARVEAALVAGDNNQ